MASRDKAATKLDLWQKTSLKKDQQNFAKRLLLCGKFAIRFSISFSTNILAFYKICGYTPV